MKFKTTILVLWAIASHSQAALVASGDHLSINSISRAASSTSSYLGATTTPYRDTDTNYNLVFAYNQNFRSVLGTVNARARIYPSATVIHDGESVNLTQMLNFRTTLRSSIEPGQSGQPSNSLTTAYSASYEIIIPVISGNVSLLFGRSFGDSISSHDRGSRLIEFTYKITNVTQGSELVYIEDHHSSSSGGKYDSFLINVNSGDVLKLEEQGTAYVDHSVSQALDRRNIASFTSQSQFGLVASVPEPTSIIFIGISSCCLLIRKREFSL